MAAYYAWAQNLLPFQWAQYSFMLNALLAVFLVSPLFGILGTMVVNNKMAFFSDAIGHSALTGIAIGVLLGMRDPLAAMLAFSVLLAIGISLVKAHGKSSPDTVIGVFSSTAVALGIVILSRGGGFARYSNFLIGDLLSITVQEILMLLIVLIIVLLFWARFFNQLLLVSVNPSLAGSRGIKVLYIEIIFSVIMAIVVTISIQWVGILIINSLLILPAAAARNIAGNMRQYHVIAVLIAIISGLTGLILSYYWGTATGATIVLCASLFYVLTLWGYAKFN
ncbi:ABC-3 [Syntrophomonas zehnderi OL-4]|uniref:ABC-3 n=1 Tax=Syntrophomonas zehnderi OL-4 TaxID=690567 RepID=A0A0E4G9W5_9FIRM|nr:metal ABC transporter permease [Syntrophomonas zehnderi]CFX27428.1 ABC-3 [Syntrophomonas zehnderi OL-4]